MHHLKPLICMHFQSSFIVFIVYFELYVGVVTIVISTLTKGYLRKNACYILVVYVSKITDSARAATNCCQLRQMPAPAAAPAAATAPAATEAVASRAKPQYPFDPATHACVVDLRALCKLPAEPDEDGVHTLRALVMHKGKTVHVPDEPGCYATMEKAHVQSAVSLVHFDPATKRSDELLLSFVDYGMVSTSMLGVYVETLQLPLQKARNIYEETPRFTSMKDVSGFTNINHKSQPWCALLKPVLERQKMMNALGVFNSLDIITLMKTPLAQRLDKVHSMATEAIAAAVGELGRQDKTAAQKAKGKLESRLAATRKFFDELPPKKYDRPMKERIILVSDASDSGGGAQWLNTPLRTSMRSGSASLVATVRRSVPVIIIPPAESTPAEAAMEEPAEEQGGGEGEQGEEDEFVLSDSENEGVASVTKPSAKPSAKRMRTATNRFDAAPQVASARGRGKGKKVKTDAPVSHVAPAHVCRCQLAWPHSSFT